MKQDEVRVDRAGKENGRKNKSTCWHNMPKLLFFSAFPPTVTPLCRRSHLNPKPRPSSFLLAQSVLSRKINDLQVQAQCGARVNLADVREIFFFFFLLLLLIVFSKGHTPLPYSHCPSPQLCVQNLCLLIGPPTSTSSAAGCSNHSMPSWGGSHTAPRSQSI